MWENGRTNGAGEQTVWENGRTNGVGERSAGGHSTQELRIVLT